MDPSSLFLLSCGKLRDIDMVLLPPGLKNIVKQCCGKNKPVEAVINNHITCLENSTFNYIGTIYLTFHYIGKFGRINMIPLLLSPRFHSYGSINMTIEAAVKNNNIPFLKELLKHDISSEFTDKKDIIDTAVQEGCTIDMLKFLISDMRLTSCVDIIENVVIGGKVECLQFCIDNGASPDEATISSARYNKLDCLKLCIENNSNYNVNELMSHAVRNENLEMMKYLYSIIPPKVFYYDPRSLIHACTVGNIECVKFCLDNNFGFEDNIDLLAICCVNGNKPLSKILFEHPAFQRHALKISITEMRKKLKVENSRRYWNLGYTIRKMY